jgi:hypothetical protein
MSNLTTLLHQLPEVDSEHFHAQYNHVLWLGFAYIDRPEWIEKNAWVLAGWCLEQMQARKAEIDMILNESLSARRTLAKEIEALRPLWSEPVATLKPETFIQRYISWKRAVKEGL